MLFGCKNEDGINPDEKLEPGEGQRIVSGFVKLPENVDPKTITIVSTCGTYNLDENGAFDAIKNDIPKQFLFAEDQNGEILLASLTGNSVEELNASSTARVLVALLPWTGYVEAEDLPGILNEIADLNGFDELTVAIQASVDNGRSPLTDNAVLGKLKQLNANIAGGNGGDAGGREKEVPEVDYLVEPIIAYGNGNLTIRNDGTTTAAWGVEVFKDGVSISENLVLPGNTVKFPSLSSILGMFSGDLSSAVFEAGEPLEVPAQVDGKYEIHFKGPIRSIATSDLAREAAYYNIATSLTVILRAFGLEVKPSDLFDQGCTNELFNSTTSVLVESIEDGELTTGFFLEQVNELLKGSVESIAACADLFKNFHGSEVTAREKYLKKLVSFLNAYSKAEAVFVTSKLFGDMLVLNDLTVCRQINNNGLYPCFSLVKNQEIEAQVIGAGSVLRLEVLTEPDIAGEDGGVFPTGAKIHWEVIEGDGTLDASHSFVKSDGTAEVLYNVGEEESHIISASVKDRNSNLVESVEYTLKVAPLNYKLQIGDYHPDYSLISVQNTLSYGESVTLPNYMTQMVRLTLDDVPVKVGQYALDWTQFTFGDTPTSSEEISVKDYEVTLWDATHGKSVTIKLDVTLTNQAFARIVNQTIVSDRGSYGEPGGFPITITFSADGTYTKTYHDGSSAGSGTYGFVSVIAPSNQPCTTYTITTPKSGCIYLPAESQNVFIPNYIYVYENNTLGANSFYGCMDRYETWIIK